MSPNLRNRKEKHRNSASAFRPKEIYSLKTNGSNTGMNTPSKNNRQQKKSSFAPPAFRVFDCDGEEVLKPIHQKHSNMTFEKYKKANYSSLQCSPKKQNKENTRSQYFENYRKQAYSAFNSPMKNSQTKEEQKFKTEMCSNFKMKGFCQYGSQVFLLV